MSIAPSIYGRPSLPWLTNATATPSSATGTMVLTLWKHQEETSHNRSTDPGALAAPALIMVGEPQPLLGPCQVMGVTHLDQCDAQGRTPRVP